MTERIYAPNRIKQLRKERGISLEALGAQMRSDLTASTISKLENRRMALSLDYILDIARVLGVPPVAIVYEGDVSSVRVVPVAGSIAAGNWQEAVEMSGETMVIPSHLQGKNLFALRARGDSMDAIVPDGGFVVINPDDRELVDGKKYAVMNGDGETTLKEFCASPLRLLPCSSNPEHQPIVLGDGVFTVIGRVIYAGHDL